MSRGTKLFGALVSHHFFGRGRVRSLVDGGRLLRVVFDAFPGLTYTLPREQLKVADAPRTVVRKRRVKAAASPGGRAPEARQILEALRMGVVPGSGLATYSVGREREVRRLKKLYKEGAGLQVFLGQYGSGKSHLLELAEEMALKAGFITARIVFDPVEVPPSHPARVYHEIVRRLRYPGRASSGLRGLLDRLLQRPDIDQRTFAPFGRLGHRYLSAALFARSLACADGEEVVDFVSGASGGNADAANGCLRRMRYPGDRLLALPDYRTFGQLYAYLLGGIAVYASSAGYRGLVLLFDEAEFLDGLERTSRDMAETFLRYISAAVLRDEELAFDRGRLYRGGQAVHRSFPDRFQEGQPLAAIFAFTPLPEVERTVRSSLKKRNRIAELEPVTGRLVPELTERVVKTYRRLYPDFKVDQDEMEWLKARLPKDSTRQMLRMLVEILDLRRLAPDAFARLFAEGLVA